MRKDKREIINLIVVVLWVCVIWGHSMQNADTSTEESGFFLSLINGFLNFLGSTGVSMLFVRKAAHFTEYFILGILTLNYYWKRVGKISWKIRDVFVGSLVVCFIDETIQLFVEGRAGMVQDMWIDFAGASVGIAISIAFLYNKKRRFRNSEA